MRIKNEMRIKIDHKKDLEDMKLLQKRINYKFKNIEFLTTALSHTSYVNENRRWKLKSNERLEFLGDSVLSLIVSDYLFKHYSHLPEGELTKVRASLVCEHTLCCFAHEISLGSFLKLGKGEETAGGRQKQSILADAFEALIAAIYLDTDFSRASDFVLMFVKAHLKREEKSIFVDYKTMLQEIIQKRQDEKLKYRMVRQFGPDHDKNFEVELLLNSDVVGHGFGKTKKEAEQIAAKQALILMGKKVE